MEYVRYGGGKDATEICFSVPWEEPLLLPEALLVAVWVIDGRKRLARACSAQPRERLIMKSSKIQN